MSARWWLDLWIRPRMSSMARAWVVRHNAGPPAHPVGGEGREVVAAAAVVDAEQEAVVHHPQRLQQRAVSLQLRRHLPDAVTHVSRFETSAANLIATSTEDVWLMIARCTEALYQRSPRVPVLRQLQADVQVQILQDGAAVRRLA